MHDIGYEQDLSRDLGLESVTVCSKMQAIHYAICGYCP